MWSSWVSGLGTERAAFMHGVPRAEVSPVAPEAEAATVQKLLGELFDAQQSSKSQTVQDTRDKLNELRQKMGDEKFKEALNQLIQRSLGDYLEFLKRLLSEWFPEDSDAPPKPNDGGGGGGGGSGGGSQVNPGRGGGGGGGGGMRVNPANLGPSESMSDKPITKGAGHYDYQPDKSVPGKKPDNIWSGFSQGQEGNCTTVSSIKAAMQHFGSDPKDIFKKVELNGSNYQVEMRDGFKLTLSKDELKTAAREARFNGDDTNLITNANFLFAASAKRAHIEGNSGTANENDGNAKRSFMDAINSLNDGEHSREGLDRLGLKNHYRPGFHSDLKNGMVGTFETTGHSMAVIGNRLEQWGRRSVNPPGNGIITVLF